MATKKKKTPQSVMLITEPFRAVWPALHEPSDRFPPPSYEVQARFDPSTQDWKEFKKKVMDIGSKLYEEFANEPLPKHAHMPWREEETKDPSTEEKTKTGNVLVRFKKKAGFESKLNKQWVETPLPIFDTAGNRMKGIPVWGGSLIKVAYRIMPWKTAMGCGLSLRLEQAMVIELVSKGEGVENAFGATHEGYVVEDNEPTSEGFGNEQSEGEDKEFPY